MTKDDRLIRRRDVMAMATACLTVLPVLGCVREAQSTTDVGPLAVENTKTDPSKKPDEAPMQIHYLEIVANDVEASCGLYSTIHGMTFGDADPSLGGARTAKMANGGMMGIRAPMHEDEKPVTRAYMLVEDIESAVAAATTAGATIAVPPMDIPGHGKCAIFIQGGVEAGFWQR